MFEVRIHGRGGQGVVTAVFAGGDMVLSERTVTTSIGHGRKLPTPSTPGCTAIPAAAREAAAGQLQQSHYLVLQRRAHDCPSQARRCPPRLHVRRSGRRSRGIHRAIRGSQIPVLRELFRLRQLLRRVPRQRRREARAGQGIRVRLRLLQGLRHVRRRVPVRRDRDGAGVALTTPTRAGFPRDRQSPLP